MARRHARWGAHRGEPRYLRRDGNRMVRARRRRRTALRMTLMALLWVAAGLGAIAAYAASERWATDPRHFQLRQVIVRGNHEASEDEVHHLTQDWIGKNIFVITLADVERKVREHPWIGRSGLVRIQRRLPGSLVISVGERKAAGLALVDGVVWLVDVNGLPIDRYSPRYAAYDFPIIKGLDALRAGAGAGRAAEARLKDALAAGVSVTRALAEGEPAFYEEVSEIDVSEPDMIVVRLEDASYDLRLSRENYLKNLESYFSVRDQLGADESSIDYVDLRWQDRIAVMPAATPADGTRAGEHAHKRQGNGGR